MHKRIRVKCSCGSSVELSSIQFDDFDCGMMGFLYCPDCKTVLLPSHHRTVAIKDEMREVEGADKGWI